MKRAAAIHFLGYIFSALGALVGVSLLSHIVAADIYGKVALYIALATLFQYMVRESLGQALLRYSSDIIDNKGNARLLIRQALPGLTLSFAIICLATYFIIPSAGLAENLLSFLLIAVLGAAVIGESLLSALLHRQACAMHLNIIQWLRFLFAGLLFLQWPSINAVLAGFCLGFFIALIFDYCVWRQQAPSTQAPKQTLTIFHGYGPLIIGFCIWFTSFFDRLALEHFYSSELLGAYFVLLQLAYMPLITLMRAMASFLFPLLFQDNQPVRKTWLALLLAIVIGAAFILQWLHPWLFSWLVGPSYREYSWLLPWVYCAALIHAIAYLLQANFYQHESIKTLLYIRITSAVCCLFFVILLTPLWQIPGLIAANIITALATLILSIYYSKANNNKAKNAVN